MTRVGSTDLGQLDQPIATSSVDQTIDGTERLLDLTALSTAYPFRVEVEAQDSGMLYKQGGATVALGTTKTRLGKDQWIELTVKSASYAYVAVKQSASDTGNAVATLIGESA